MTQHKDFKRKVREHARRTGRSYSDARRLLLTNGEDGRVMNAPPFERHVDPRYGFSVALPAGWNEFPPDPGNSPYEVGRWLAVDHTNHVCLVFRMPGRPGLSARDAAERSKARLEARGFLGFTLSSEKVAGRPGVSMTFHKPQDGGGTWSAREYFVSAGSLVYCLGLASGDREGDAALFDRVAAEFAIVGGEGAGGA
jgi:hypothetical protein